MGRSRGGKGAGFEGPLAARGRGGVIGVGFFVFSTLGVALGVAVNLGGVCGAPSTDVLCDAPNRVAHLPSERDPLERPLVYHLFGKLSASPTYVISDEDLRDVRLWRERVQKAQQGMG